MRLLLFTVLLVATTAIANAGKQYRVTISIEPPINYRIIDSTWHENNVTGRIYRFKYDEERSFRDSLSAGSYSLYSRDIFGYKHKTEFQLKKDTVLSLSQQYDYQFLPAITAEELREAEQIDVVCIRSGCFHHAVSRASITRSKDPGRYRILIPQEETASLYAEGVTEDIINDLVRMQRESRDALVSANNSMSTNRWYLYMLAGNRVFFLSDHSGDLGFDAVKVYMEERLSQPFQR